MPLNWVAGLFYYNSLSTYDDITFRSPSGNALPPAVQAGGLTAAVAGLDSESFTARRILRGVWTGDMAR